MNFEKMKKQAKAMQEQLLKMQEELQSMEIEGTAGNGLISVTVNGEKDLLSLRINPECLDPNDIEGLQDLIVAAHKDAMHQLQKHQASNMSFSPPQGWGLGEID